MAAIACNSEDGIVDGVKEMKRGIIFAWGREGGSVGVAQEASWPCMVLSTCSEEKYW